MKKTLIPALIVLAVAAGVYVMFFMDRGEDGETSDPNTELAEGEGPEDTLPPAPTPEELRRQQRLNEHARPHEFITLNYSSRRNLLGEAVIEGSMSNTAELTKYSDMRLVIYFDDELGNTADSASQVVFEQIKPGETTEFRMKEKQPKRTEVRLRIAEAEADDVPKRDQGATNSNR